MEFFYNQVLSRGAPFRRPQGPGPSTRHRHGWPRPSGRDRWGPLEVHFPVEKEDTVLVKHVHISIHCRS